LCGSQIVTHMYARVISRPDVIQGDYNIFRFVDAWLVLLYSIYMIQPVVKPVYNWFDNQLDVSLHNTTCCPTGCQSGLTADLTPVVLCIQTFNRLVWQQVASCKWVLGLVPSLHHYQRKRLAGKTSPEVPMFVSSGALNLNSVNMFDCSWLQYMKFDCRLCFSFAILPSFFRRCCVDDRKGRCFCFHSVETATYFEASSCCHWL